MSSALESPKLHKRNQELFDAVFGKGAAYDWVFEILETHIATLREQHWSEDMLRFDKLATDSTMMNQTDLKTIVSEVSALVNKGVIHWGDYPTIFGLHRLYQLDDEPEGNPQAQLAELMLEMQQRAKPLRTIHLEMARPGLWHF